MKRFTTAVVLLTACAAAAQAQDAPPPSHRYRVTLGPGIGPRYPGADNYRLQPLVNVDRANGDEPFAFEAADESFAVSLVNRNGFAFGPALNFESTRRARDVGANVPRVGFTVEAGGFVQYQLPPGFRLRAEARQGLGGHKGLIGVLGADYVARDADRWLFSVGPRVTLVNDRYSRSYFGISPQTALLTGLPAYRAKGGLEAVGATAGALRQLSPHWGVTGYVKYDRLVDDPARSPLVRNYGSRDQFSGGIGLSYTFGR